MKESHLILRPSRTLDSSGPSPRGGGPRGPRSRKFLCLCSPPLSIVVDLQIDGQKGQSANGILFCLRCSGMALRSLNGEGAQIRASSVRFVFLLLSRQKMFSGSNQVKISSPKRQVGIGGLFKHAEGPRDMGSDEINTDAASFPTITLFILHQKRSTTHHEILAWFPLRRDEGG